MKFIADDTTFEVYSAGEVNRLMEFKKVYKRMKRRLNMGKRKCIGHCKLNEWKERRMFRSSSLKQTLIMF